MRPGPSDTSFGPSDTSFGPSDTSFGPGQETENHLNYDQITSYELCMQILRRSNIAQNPNFICLDLLLQSKKIIFLGPAPSKVTLIYTINCCTNN